jgi:hypothetical protein
MTRGVGTYYVIMSRVSNGRSRSLARNAGARPVQVVRRFIPNTRTNIMREKMNKVEEDNLHTSTQA